MNLHRLNDKILIKFELKYTEFLGFYIPEENLERNMSQREKMNDAFKMLTLTRLRPCERDKHLRPGLFVVQRLWNANPNKERSLSVIPTLHVHL